MKRKSIILFHFIAWLYVIYPEFSGFWINPDQLDPLFYYLLPVNCVLQILSFYYFFFGCHLLIANRRKKLPGVIILAFSVFLIWFLRIIFYYYYDTKIIGLNIPGNFPFFARPLVLIELQSTFILAVYAVLFRLFFDWVSLQRQKDQLINQNQASELAYLRSQINPHFLFNTLNNIYALIGKKPPEAQEAVMKLSVIMRYMLYESALDKVRLERELENLKSFIELESLRIRDTAFVLFHISGSPGEKMIAPFLLFPLIENTFKHANREIPSPGIEIEIMISPNEVELKTRNYILPDQEKDPDEPGGLGIANVKRRLELLYPDHHHFQITENEGQFFVSLKIEC